MNHTTIAVSKEWIRRPSYIRYYKEVRSLCDLGCHAYAMGGGKRELYYLCDVAD